MGKSRMVLLILSLCLFTKESSFAQLGISHEIGVLVGPLSFFTDYGERWEIDNNVKNSGFGIGLVHYMNFAYKAECNCYSSDKYFNDHFKIRTEIDYFYTKLEHFGPVALKKIPMVENCYEPCTEKRKHLKLAHTWNIIP